MSNVYSSLSLVLCTNRHTFSEQLNNCFYAMNSCLDIESLECSTYKHTTVSQAVSVETGLDPISVWCKKKH